MLGGMRYWLIKSEPDVFGIADLERVGVESWDGVRNYQARNFMRDEMRVGDLALFYHSNASPSGVAGVARVASEAHPDRKALDPGSEYFDPKSSAENPRWWMVDFEFVARLPRFVSLDELRGDGQLAGMMVLSKGSRLSITPVEAAHFKRICRHGGLDPARLG